MAGGLAALTQAPFDVVPLMLAWPVILSLGADAATARRAALIGWLAGVGYFGLGLSWIVEPFLVDVARHGLLAPPALISLAGGLSLFWALAFYAGWRLSGNRLARLLALALLLALAEFGRSVLFTGFPWNLPAYGWLETPVIQSVAWFGPHVLTVITLVIAALLARRQPMAVVAGVAGLVLLLVPSLTIGPAMGGDTGVMVRIVQPNAAQHLKWQPGHMQTFYDRQLSATAAEPSVDVVIWPEISAPWLLGERPDLETELRQTAGQDTRIIFGIRRTDADSNWFNSLAVLGRGRTEAVYDKAHLVPFGEYMPFNAWVNRLGIGAFASDRLSGFTAGSGPASIALPGLPAFAPMICYEAIFPGVMPSGPRPGWIVHITNDAWFGDWTGPYQHLAQARIRAIEQGLPVARAANTGVSAMIAPDGSVLASLPLGQHGHFDIALPAAGPETLYARLPHANLLFLAGVLLGLALCRHLGRSGG